MAVTLLMVYQVIARKYRPQRFRDVVGQDHIVRTLVNAVEQNRIAHAYLFAGPRGTGKTTIARIFAKCLNCQNGPAVDFSDDDPRCQEIAESRSLDVLEIDGASNRGIEEIRELRETARYAPSSSRFKIYIIDEVHMLTKEAFNALLKTLEEPPEHVMFLFATTEPDKMLPTILSRCQRFDLRRIPVALMVDHLRDIAEKEGVQIADAALQAIARGAEGGLRDAESALDQLISFCGTRIEEDEVLSMFGLTARAQLFDLSRALLTGEQDRLLQELNRLASAGKDLGRLLSDLLNHIRNLMVYQVSGGDLSLLEATETESLALQEQAGLVPAEALTRMMDRLTRAERELRDAGSKRILLEVALLEAAEARRAVSVDALLKQLDRLRQGDGDQTGREAVPGAHDSDQPPERPRPAKKSSPPPKPAADASSGNKTAPEKPAESSPAFEGDPAPESGSTGASAPSSRDTSEPASSNPTGLSELWEKLVRAAAQASPFVKNYLLEAHPVSLTQKTLTIGMDPEHADHLGLLDVNRNHKLLTGKLEELGYPEMRIRFIEASRPSGFVPPKLDPASTSSASAEPEASREPEPTGGAVDSEAGQEGAKRQESAQTTRTTEPGAGTAPEKIDPEEFRNDPLIQQALEIFKGQIVEVDQ